jgi:polyisoprenoid-binding protein YceI
MKWLTSRTWKRKRWILGGVIATLLVTVVGPYVYIHFIEGKAPAPLSLATTIPTTAESVSAPASGTDGTWTIASGSQVGYRVKEVLFGQDNEAVGRTSSITGTATLNGTTLRAATFTVDMTTVSSDQERRDRQFNGRIMDTASYPTATFTLSKAVTLGSLPAAGVQRSVQVTGNLTMHGTTRSVTFTLTGRRVGNTVQASGSIPITFAEWNIGNPSFGPVSTEDHGTLEFLLNMKHA